MKNFYLLLFVGLFSSFYGQFPGVDNNVGTGTFTVPANVTHVNVAAWGGGGGGGGSNSNGNGGNGGGGGGAASGQLAVSTGNSFTYAVGIGGLAGTVAGGTGGNGASSSVTSLLPAITFTANGGTGGRGNAAALNTPTNSGGGTASGGATNSNGVDGLPAGTSGGNGGNSGTAFTIFGTGGTGVQSANGNPGGTPGAGGGGGRRTAGNNRAGGAGADGQVMFDFIAVSSVTPSPVCVGSTITIKGNYFSNAGATTVTVNNTACTSVTVVDANTITAVIAPGTTSGVVDINNNGRKNNGKSITVNASPASVTVSLTSSACGSSVITASGGAGGTIYFQGTTSGGTSTANSSLSQTITTSGTYYFRSLNAAGCWGPEGSLAVTVNAIPTATTVTGGGTFCGSAIITASGGTGGTIYFQGTISGGTSTATPSTSQTVTASGTYYFNSRSAAGCWGTQGSVTVTINPNPVITAQPTATAICTNAAGNFSVTATGATAYQWRRNGVNLTNTAPYSGVNTATLTITNPAVAAAGNFDVVVTNASGCSVTSSAVALTVNDLPALATVPVPANNATGVCYAGSGAISVISWTAAARATSYDVYFGAGSLPGTVTANVTTTTYTVGALLPNTTYFWKIVPRNACGITAGAPVTWQFTTSAGPCYCQPTVQYPNDLYINSVAIVGTMQDPPVNTSGAGLVNGYSDYTALPQIAQQAQGEGVNVLASVTGNFYLRGTWKAWVDWNNDGDFDDPGEQVYNIFGFVGQSVNFGFVVPSNQTPGNYRMRMRVNNGPNSYDFGTCDNFNWSTTGSGETEDYLIKVIENCSAKITGVTKGSECFVTGGKAVTLAATSSEVVSEFRWYTSATGGSYTATAPDATGKATVFTTPLISTTTTYYVTAKKAGTGCESTFRVPVTAEIKQTPTVTFTPSVLEVCGESAAQVSATGGNEVVHLVNENFNGTLGTDPPSKFININSDANGAAVDNLTKFQNSTSVYNPNTNVWFPAISSGFGGNKFVSATSDAKANYPTSPVENSLTLINSVNTTGLTNLTLKMRMYYARYWADNNNPAANEEYVAIEISTNGGSTYPIQIAKLITNQGLAGNFATLTYDLTPYIGQTNLKFRIRHYSSAGSAGWLPDGVAIDDVELFGERPLQPSFTWTSNNPIGVFTDAAGTTPYTGGPISTIYFKPSAAQLENYSGWNLTATATLANLCDASGSISIGNKSKVWNNASNDWNTTNWKPDPAVPTADKCVIVKSPVNIFSGTNGLAKNVIVESTGSLNIKGGASLSVTDFVKNQATADKFIVESDGNLLQTNDAAANSGTITAKRNITLSTGRQQYNYVISPVEGQSLKDIYKDALGNPVTVPYVLYHVESNNKFYSSSGAYIKGRGLAVKEPTTASFPTGPMSATFTGAHTNGSFTYGVVNSGVGNPDRGFNLIGNPYPSNIDLVTFYSLNGTSTAGMDPTFLFWDSTANSRTAQEGDGYDGKAYAQFNASTPPGIGSGTAATGDPGLAGSKAPKRYVKTAQGFMARTLIASKILTFNNSIRSVNTTANGYFGKNGETQPEPDRYWIDMISPQNIASNIAVVYFAGGIDGYTIEDSRSMLASDAVYSLVDDEKISINGKNSFAPTDKVPLGTKHFESGIYKIALNTAQGVFANGQNIYLKDYQTGTVTNLSEGSYSFTATAGESTGRFEIIYQPEIVLTTDAAVKENLIVYKDGTDFVVKSPGKKLNMIEVFDGAGRTIFNIRPNSNKAVIDGTQLNSAMYVLKIYQDGAVTSRKIVK